MARRSSGRGRSVRSAPPPSKRASSQPASHAPAAAPAPAPTGGVGLVGAVVDGFGWGTGTAMAHRAMDSIFGPRTIRHEAAVVPESAPSKAESYDACSVHSKAFQDCLNGYGDEISKCQVYMDMLAQCKRNSGSMMSS